MATIPKPDVFVKQEFVTTSPTLIAPSLPLMIVGVNKQVEFKQNAGAYDATATSYSYPNLPEGAEVETASVLAYLTNSHGTFAIDDDDFTADADSVDVEDNITITRTVIASTGSGETTATTTTYAPPNPSDGETDTTTPYVFTGSDFQTNGVKPGMSLFILSGADIGIYQVAAVASETSLTVDLKSDGTNWKPFAGFTDTASSLSYRVMADGSSFTDEEADFLDDGVVPGMSLVIESGDNAGTWRIEKVVSDVELLLNQILLDTEFASGDTTVGTTTFTDSGKNFTTIGVKAGDTLIIETEDDAGERTIATVGTTTLTVEGANFAGDTGADYRIVRVFETEDDVQYRIDERSSIVTGDVLISYTAVRTDNIDDVVTIETLDELEEKLGPAIPENPLGFAAFLALQNTDTTVQATAIEDDTTNDHTQAAEFLESREVYSIAVLSQLPAVHQIWAAHVEQMSDEESKHERICFINRELFVYETKTTGSDGLVTAATDFSAATGDFINDEVTAGMYVKILEEGVVTESARIVRVVDGQTLELVAPGLTVSAYEQDYRIDTKDLDKTEQAQFIADYSTAFANRRVFNAWPDEIQVSYEEDSHGDDTFDTSETEITGEVAGYFAGAIVGAMVANYPPQQPFTNLPFAGIIGLQHSNEYFSATQLDIIATGGTYILVQDTPTAPCYCRHQLSTDVSLIEKRELSITKDVDYISKMVRDTLRPYIGKYNITKTFLEMLRTITEGVLRKLVSEGQLINGTLVSLAQSEDQPDTVLVEIDLLVPYPCNYIRVTLLI